MEPTTLILGIMAGFMLGVLIAQWSWRHTIKYKSESGTRLCVGNKLYHIYLDEDLTAENIQCPVCGYYCIGNGGNGCIDKPNLVEYKNMENE